MEYEEGIIEALLLYARKNSHGAYYIDIPEIGTLVYSDEVLKIFNKDFENFSELSDEVQYNIYSFIQDNHTILYTLIKENLVEIGGVDDMDWAIAPQLFYAPSMEEGKEDIVIGSMAVAREVLEEGELRSVIFISPDGTWTTLTCYKDGYEVEKKVAQGDLGVIAEGIKNFIDKL